MFTSLRFLCFGNTPLPSLNSSRSPQRTPSLGSSSTSSLSPIEEELATPSTPESNDNGLTLSSSIGPYPIPSSLMREVESIRSHILQQKSRHQNQPSRRHKQKNRRQRLQEVAIKQSIACSIREKAKPIATPTCYYDVSSPYAEDTSVFELNPAGEKNTNEEEEFGIASQHDWDEMINPHYNYLGTQEQIWDGDLDSSAYWGLDDLISQGYFETYDNSSVVCHPKQDANTDESYSISKALTISRNVKQPNGDTGWWLVKHVDPRALSKLGSDCVIL
ncbi:hypothetical protein EYR41_000712 [Orbilia oligospora]|uniref:Uncharacterized protein n=1 Tax=Orbilia oligospora TaxID=2813651 RepID=A0A7C8PTB1_ORBOL|nr:hypothetical protein TWF751_000877 [Orbilia oligospora]KAF3293010.1 hypothetical protein TWF132_005012 [Orbilia oligospora]TGJ73628.1 hypothetical protein EYR41_000712 [Orbilia oligospora]